MELNQQQLEVFGKAAVLCSKSEKCSHDILYKLSGWGLSEDDAMVVLDRLVNEKYLDDERYARSYVRDKFKFNKWGKVKITYQLRTRHISSNTIDDALQEINEDEYRELLLVLITDKNRSVKAANKYDRKAKLLRFAQSRGFEMDLIYHAMDDVLNNEDL